MPLAPESRSSLRSASLRVTVRWLPLWATTTLLLLASFAHPVTTPADEDEFYWIGSAYYFDLAWAHADWSHADWQLLPARENPPVAKYVLGLGLHLAGAAVTTPDILGTFYLMFERVPGAWGDGDAYTKRAAVAARVNPALRDQARNGARLTLAPNLLLGARGAALACAGVASFLMLVLGAHTGSGLAGWIASQLLLLHPAVVEAYNHAHADIVAVVFSVAAVLAATCTRQHLNPSSDAALVKRWLLTLLSGVLLGLACGAKMNALPAAVAALAVIAIPNEFGSWRQPREIVRRLSAVAAAASAGFVTFVLVNPTLLQDLSGGLRAVVQQHRLTEEIQAAFLSGHLTTWTAKLRVVAALVGRVEIVSVIVTFLAAFLLITRPRQSGLFALWFFVSAIAVTAWIPFARERYVLPVVIPSVLLVGLALADIVTRIHRLASPRSTAVPDQRVAP